MTRRSSFAENDFRVELAPLQCQVPRPWHRHAATKLPGRGTLRGLAVCLIYNSQWLLGACWYKNASKGRPNSDETANSISSEKKEEEFMQWRLQSLHHFFSVSSFQVNCFVTRLFNLKERKSWCFNSLRKDLTKLSRILSLGRYLSVLLCL